MKKEKNKKRRVPQQDGKGMVAQMQTSVEIISLATEICKCSEKDYERLFIREPEVKARAGKMAYVRPEYHDRIMRITRVIMGSRKVNTEGIDEELLIASIGRRRQDGTLYHAQEPPAPAPEEESVPETEPPPVQYTAKEKPQRDTVRRKRQEDDYSGLFLRRNEIKTRQCVYISRDVHSKILKIVNDIAGREISVGGYVDTVLRQHLEQHKEKINELYKKQREDLI